MSIFKRNAAEESDYSSEVYCSILKTIGDDDLNTLVRLLTSNDEIVDVYGNKKLNPLHYYDLKSKTMNIHHQFRSALIKERDRRREIDTRIDLKIRIKK